ncbi:MAG: SPOR domain-containing protein [Bacteroidota bacterium]
MLESFRQYNKKKGMQGFRVQIYSASGNRSRLLTERVKAEFDSTYPGINSYITYDEPYFKLRVGDFRTRLDAQRFEKELSAEYIYATVVVDRISLPPLKEPDIQPFIRKEAQEE